MYYILKNDKMYDSSARIDEPKDLPIALDFMGGKKVTIPVDGPMVFTTNAKANNTLRDFLDSDFPIISKRFFELFQDAGVDNIQAFPVIIKSACLKLMVSALIVKK